MSRRRPRNDPPRPVNSWALRGLCRGGPLDGQFAAPGFLSAYRRTDGTAGHVDRTQPHYRLHGDRTYQYVYPILNPEES